MSALEDVLGPIQPRKEPVQLRSRERFQRILDVAVDLILEKGVDAVAMSDIAELARISIASLYQYFPDKAAIVATLAERYNAEGQACVQDVFAGVTSPAGMKPALLLMIDSYFEFFASVPGARAIWQATQADRRLQRLDTADMDQHAQTISAAFRKVRPGMTHVEAMRLGQLLTGIVAVTVRAAAAMAPGEGRAMIEACKAHVLIPCIDGLLAPADHPFKPDLEASADGS